jgi:hypothetical protein
MDARTQPRSRGKCERAGGIHITGRSTPPPPPPQPGEGGQATAAAGQVRGGREEKRAWRARGWVGGWVGGGAGAEWACSAGGAGGVSHCEAAAAHLFQHPHLRTPAHQRHIGALAHDLRLHSTAQHSTASQPKANTHPSPPTSWVASLSLSLPPSPCLCLCLGLPVYMSICLAPPPTSTAHCALRTATTTTHL